jgi:UDP:flavonoid glycosyltransferase YjiC (YdhE family)
MRVLLGAFGDPGHAFPMLALGEALVARGHTVCLQTWQRWCGPAEQAGLAFAAAPEYQVFPTAERPLKPYEAAVRAAVDTRPVVREFRPDVAVSDVLTPAPALAAELEGVPVATVVPHLFPYPPPGFPPFSIGARLPRTALGRLAWRQTEGLVAKGLELGRREYNDCRTRLGLEPLPWVHTGMSRELTLVATFPQLEYPREWPCWTRVTGPLMWEPAGAHVAPPPGDGPVVLVAPSTAQDRGQRLLRAALAGLAGEPVRVIAIAAESNARPIPVPENAVVVPWMSYARTMPNVDVVVCHGGHGTLVRALASGRPVVVCPAGGDMAENAARVDWAGLGVRLPPRFCRPGGVRVAVRRALRLSRLRRRAEALARWSAGHDGPQRAAVEVEQWAARRLSAG